MGVTFDEGGRRRRGVAFLFLRYLSTGVSEGTKSKSNYPSPTPCTYRQLDTARSLPRGMYCIFIRYCTTIYST